MVDSNQYKIVTHISYSVFFLFILSLYLDAIKYPELLKKKKSTELWYGVVPIICESILEDPFVLRKIYCFYII